MSDTGIEARELPFVKLQRHYSMRCKQGCITLEILLVTKHLSSSQEISESNFLTAFQEEQEFHAAGALLHGFLMIFFLVMPGLFGGFGNYFVVIFQGSPEL